MSLLPEVYQFVLEYDEDARWLIATERIEDEAFDEAFGASQIVATNVDKWFAKAVLTLWERWDED